MFNGLSLLILILAALFILYYARYGWGTPRTYVVHDTNGTVASRHITFDQAAYYCGAYNTTARDTTYYVTDCRK